MPRAADRVTPHVVLLRNVFDNLGDAAMLESEIDALRRHVPEAAVTVLSDDRRLAERFPGVRWGDSDVVLGAPVSSATRHAVRSALSSRVPSAWRATSNRVLSVLAARHRHRSIRRFVAAAEERSPGATSAPLSAREHTLLDTLKSASVVLGGGGLLRAIPAISEPRRAVYRALRALGIPYVLNGLSATDEWDDETYSGAALVIVRDRPISEARVVKCGVDRSRLLNAIDPAFTLQQADELTTTAALESNGLACGAFVAVNVRQTDAATTERLGRHLAEVLPAFARSLDAPKVLLFGMQRHRDIHDGRVLDPLARQLCHQVPVAVWLPESPGLLRAVLARAAAVVSARYHGAVFGLATAVPTIGLVLSREYDVKMRGLFHWYDLSRFVLSVDEFCSSAGRSTLDDIRQRADTISAELRAANRRFMEDLDRPYERVAAIARGRMFTP